MADRIHPDTNIGLVKLRVSDLQRSIRFYSDVVGFKVLDERDGTADLTADGKRALVRIQEIAGAVVPPRKSAAGLYHYAILVPDRRSLGVVLRNLIRTGIHVGQADHLVSEALYIADPDHNGIEIYVDRPRETWGYDAVGHVRMAVDPIDWDGLLLEAADTPWNGLPAATTMGHIHLHVSDLAATKHFYEEVLGFDVMAQMGNAALFVAAGGYHHHIGLNTWAGVGAQLSPDNAAGLAFYEIMVPTAEAMMEVVARLNEAAVPIREEEGSVVFHDPTGIEIHLRPG
ncbi:MAG: Catechol 2,3-dioxygenase [Cohnella sp.]|nr:Catechol 2,3-dioxygenase [Cohnella sp.]